jgi:hypothetical protein
VRGSATGAERVPKRSRRRKDCWRCSTSCTALGATLDSG